MPFDQLQNLRDAILKKKARIANWERTLNRPPLTSYRGLPVKPGGGRFRLEERRQHELFALAEQERELARLQQMNSRSSDKPPEPEPTGTRHSGVKTSPAQVGNADLGKTIDVLYEELKRLKGYARGRRKTESDLRSYYPELQLWKEIDASESLPHPQRDRFWLKGTAIAPIVR